MKGEKRGKYFLTFIFLFLLVFSFSSVSAFSFSDFLGKITGKPIASEVMACPSFPCFFDANAQISGNITVDTPPAIVSALYPYGFNLSKETNVKMNLNYQIFQPTSYRWSTKPLSPNILYIKIDGNEVFNNSYTKTSLIENKEINLGVLIQGPHTIEIYASKPTYFMFDWFNLTEVPIPVTCNDSDVNITYPDGKNYYQKGILNFGEILGDDYCIVGNQVVEHFCINNNSNWNVTSYNCSAEGKVCQDGACKSAPITNVTNSFCNDSDGPRTSSREDLKINGTCKNSTGTYSDILATTITNGVREYYCFKNECLWVEEK